MKRAFWVAVDAVLVLNIAVRLAHGPQPGLSGQLINDGMFLAAGLILGTWMVLAYLNYQLRHLGA